MPVDDDAVGDDDSTNTTHYPLFHYEDIQKASGSSMSNSPGALTNVSAFMPEALQKNLSTTMTPFLPSEQRQPDNWPKIVGCLFLVIALVLIAATIIRNCRNSSKRKNYEEIQSLVV